MTAPIHTSYTITPDDGPDIVLTTGSWHGEPSLSMFVGDTLVVMRQDTADSLLELLGKLTRRH
jgi:hypothetical protein